MAMEPKTMSDVLELTRRWHKQLSQHLHSSADETGSERNDMLLEYLSEHEQKLAETLEYFQRDADIEALNTWFYEYTDRHKIIHRDPHEIPFTRMSNDEITGEIAVLHNQLVDLYRHLHERAESETAREVLQQLLDIERSESRLISVGAERSQEM